MFFESAFINEFLRHTIRLNFYLVDLVPFLYSDFPSASYEEFSFNFSTFSAAPPRVSPDPSSFFGIFVLSLLYPKGMVELVLLFAFTIKTK